MCEKMKELDTSINHDEGGLCVRLAVCQKQTDENSESMKVKNEEIRKDVSQLQVDNKILKGIVQRQSKQISVLNEKVAMLTAKSMENNLVIKSLEGDEKGENCKEVAVKFLEEHTSISVDADDIYVAHRYGKKTPGKIRNIILRCAPKMKDRIMEHKKELKGKKNSKGEDYVIFAQLPEHSIEQKHENKETIRIQKDKDKDLPVRERSEIQVISGKVHIDGKVPRKHLLPVQPVDLFQDPNEIEKMAKLNLAGTDTFDTEDNTFIAYALHTGNFTEVKRAYRKVRMIHPGADHVVAAYNFQNGIQGYQDDGEIAAGFKLMEYIKAELFCFLSLFSYTNLAISKINTNVIILSFFFHCFRKY